MSQAAAETGVGPTAMVALEQYFPRHQRIIVDDLAYWMLPFSARAFVWAMQPPPARDWIVRATEGAFPGLWSGIVCRKRHIDEVLIAARREIDAVVNLGAGFDTRAYRLQPVVEIPVWEVDQPVNIQSKQHRLRRRFGRVPPHAALVAVDFDHEALEPALASQGYTRHRRTFFIWEAVTQYLTEAGIRATLDFLAAAAHGSRLAFTYALQDFVDGRELHGQERLYDRYVRRGIWLFGLDPRNVCDFLDPYGWRVTEHLGCDELADRYVRATGRRLTSWTIERVVYAEKL
jgi:methyltransferase (TIGR00027 family)